jgi:hypothetical protein
VIDQRLFVLYYISTPVGRWNAGYIMVVYEQIDDVRIYPVTAYDLEE